MCLVMGEGWVLLGSPHSAVLFRMFFWTVRKWHGAARGTPLNPDVHGNLGAS